MLFEKKRLLPLLQIKDLSIDFFTDDGEVNAVKNISFHIDRGEIVALVGESGSGKSVTALSILQLLATNATKIKGNIKFSHDGLDSVEILSAREGQLQQIRGDQIAMIFQEPMTSLNPVMTCGDQVMEVLLQHKSIDRTRARELTIEWFTKVKLPDPTGMLSRYPHQLSGGQKQRVMIAMAMSCNPSLLICDEPTTALDVTVQKTILDLLVELQSEYRFGVLFITHDLGVVNDLAHRVIVMRHGKIVESGSKEQIFQSPQHPYTKGLLACRPGLQPKGKKLPVIADFIDGVKTEPEPIVIAPTQKDKKIVVSVRNLTVRFPAQRTFFGRPSKFITAVDNVSFDVLQSETLGIVGESGSGKTTLGRAILRLVEPTSGTIVINGKTAHQNSKPDLSELRRTVQIVFQDPYSSLNPRISIGNAIAETMKVHSTLSGDAIQTKVEGLLDKVTLDAKFFNRYPHEFSGGQRQRIVIARALAMDPSILVCDESVSALDVSVQAQVLNLLNDIKREFGLTIVFISHDLSVVRYMCDRIIVMKNGSIVEAGVAEDVYARPQHAYTRSLLEAIPGKMA